MHGDQGLMPALGGSQCAWASVLDLYDCVQQKREEAEGTATVSEEAAAVSEEAAAASDAPAAMDASEAESDSGTGRSGRAFSRGRSSRAVQKPEEEAPAKQPNPRSKKVRRPLDSPCSWPMLRCMVMGAWCMHGVAGGLRARCLNCMVV